MARGFNAAGGKLEGMEAVQRRLMELKKGLANKIARKAITEATKPITKDVKANVPTRSKALKKAIGRKVKTGKKAGVVYGIIGARRKKAIMYKGKLVNPTKYFHLVEFGRRAVPVKGLTKKVMSSGKAGGKIYGKKAKSVPPYAPLRKAWARGKSQAEATIKRVTWAGIQAAVK